MSRFWARRGYVVDARRNDASLIAGLTPNLTLRVSASALELPILGGEILVMRSFLANSDIMRPTIY